MRYTTLKNPVVEQASENLSKPVGDFLRISLVSLDSSVLNVLTTELQAKSQSSIVIGADYGSKECGPKLNVSFANEKETAFEKRLQIKLVSPQN